MKKWIITAVCIVFSVIIGLSMLKKDTITLVINNTINEDIDSLNLHYTGLKNDIEIPIIKANDNIKFKVNINKSFQEGSMKIYYIDKNNKKIETVIIGYFEEGYSETINVEISMKNEVIQITTD